MGEPKVQLLLPHKRWKCLRQDREQNPRKIPEEAGFKPLQQPKPTYKVEQGNQAVAEWSTRPENVHRREGRANETREALGLKGQAAKHVQTESWAFSLYISPDIPDIF